MSMINSYLLMKGIMFMYIILPYNLFSSLKSYMHYYVN